MFSHSSGRMEGGTWGYTEHYKKLHVSKLFSVPYPTSKVTCAWERTVDWLLVNGLITTNGKLTNTRNTKVKCFSVLNESFMHLSLASYLLVQFLSSPPSSSVWVCQPHQPGCPCVAPESQKKTHSGDQCAPLACEGMTRLSCSDENTRSSSYCSLSPTKTEEYLLNCSFKMEP